MSRRGFTLTETLIIGALFGLMILVGTLLLGAERARVRDANRIADMTNVASAFGLMFAQKASYADAAAGCSTVGSAVSTCNLNGVVATISEIRDPGRFSYTISRVPDRDDFGVQFRLEKRYGQFLPGSHVLSKTGIQ